MKCSRSRTRQWWKALRNDVQLLCGSHLFFQALYEDPMQFGARIMDVVLWAGGKSLLHAADFGIVQLPLLQKLRIRSFNYTWDFFSKTSVVYCRVFLQPELHKFLYIGSSSQSLGEREWTRWSKFKQIRSGKDVCGELCLWWHHTKHNFHVPIPLVVMHVPLEHCLHTLEQTFINLLEPLLNAPWTSMETGRFWIQFDAFADGQFLGDNSADIVAEAWLFKASSRRCSGHLELLTPLCMRCKFCSIWLQMA